MGYEVNNFIYLSEIINLPVLNAADNKRIGRLTDLAATTIQVYPRITGLITKIKGKKEPVYVSWNNVKKTQYKKYISIDYSPNIITSGSKATENEIILGETFLDKQIISTSGYKVVRVNDLQLLIDDSSKENPNLWLVHIDIGFKGVLRRLGGLSFFNAIFRWLFSRDIRDKFVPWKYVQPTATTNVFGSLHLKIDSSRLAEIHPADLADILEDLGTDERISLLESLDYLTAAATLQEIPIKIRVQISETLETKKLAGIINEMQMDEAVDLLDELSPEKRNGLFRVLDPEKVSEIKELSKLSAYSVGSIMNPSFITAKSTHTVGEVLGILKSEVDRSELIYYIYILDDEDRLKGTVTLRHLLSSDQNVKISEIMNENVISVKIDTNKKQVAKIFFKYNFDAVPVVDDEDRIQGIVTLRDALEKVFPEIGEE
jgi:CBS domain-containing protein/sporulation protein YlmC with PRC-barrel domain